MLQVSQNSQKNIKKEIPAQMPSGEFCEISHDIFFKEPFVRLLLHKQTLLLFRKKFSLLLSKKRSYIFSGSVFFRLNFQACNQREPTISSHQPEAYFQPSEISAIEFFLQKYLQFKTVKNFRKESSLALPGSKYASVSSHLKVQ